jgi:hypothetical protein
VGKSVSCQKRQEPAADMVSQSADAIRQG